MAVVRAAGGLLWRDGKKGRSGARLAVIHRPHRKDWSLPKGKLDDGETWEACALREVREETGCEGRIASFAGAMTYVPRNNPKIVLYWHMEMTHEGKLEAKFRDEIDEVAWLTPEEALGRLDYPGERRIVERFPEGFVLPLRNAHAPREEGLSAEVLALRADLLRRVTSLTSDDGASGLGPALDLVAGAEDAAANGRSEEARLVLCAARRMALLSLREPERTLRARVLLEEAAALPASSRRAIQALLAGGKASAEAVYLAAELRDEARALATTRATTARAAREQDRESTLDVSAPPPAPAEDTAKVADDEPASVRVDEPSEDVVEHRGGHQPQRRQAKVGWAVLSAVAGLALLGVTGVCLGAPHATTVITSAVIGGAAGFLASRRGR